jgi:hypothetical protein
MNYFYIFALFILLLTNLNSKPVEFKKKVEIKPTPNDDGKN